MVVDIVDDSHLFSLVAFSVQAAFSLKFMLKPLKSAPEALKPEAIAIVGGEHH